MPPISINDIMRVFMLLFLLSTLFRGLFKNYADAANTMAESYGGGRGKVIILFKLAL